MSDQTGVQQSPPTRRAYAGLDDAIAASINVNNPRAWLTRIQDRYQPLGEYDQGGVIAVEYDSMADLLAFADLAYSWAVAQEHRP